VSIEVDNKFPIEDGFESTRLVFVKESNVHRVWHICDMAMGGKKWHNTIYLTALHGHPVEAGIMCYTVLQCQLRYSDLDYFCIRCLDEYEMAKEIIEQKKMLKFS
jgi:hypothetical protein